MLADADLALDTANPSMGLMQANVLLAEAIPNLRIIMDHLPSFDPTPEGKQAYEDVVKAMADRPNIVVKLSEVYHPRLTDNVIVKDYEFPLRARLEYLFGMFGEDRVIFGSDYPEQLWRRDGSGRGWIGKEVLLDEANAGGAGEVFLEEFGADV